MIYSINEDDLKFDSENENKEEWETNNNNNQNNNGAIISFFILFNHIFNVA